MDFLKNCQYWVNIVFWPSILSYAEDTLLNFSLSPVKLDACLFFNITSMEKINIRAKFPNGEVWNLPPLDGAAPLETVITQIRLHKGWQNDPRLVLAGPPPKPLLAEALTPLQTLIPGKTAVIFVHPQHPHTPDASVSTATTSARRGTRISKPTKTHRDKSTRAPRQLGNRSAPYTTFKDLRSTKRKTVRPSVTNGDNVDCDDANDRDWDAGQNVTLSDAETDEISAPRTKRTRARGRTSKAGQKTNSTVERRAKRTRVSKLDETAEAGGRTLLAEGDFEPGREDVGDPTMIATDIGVPHVEGKLALILAQSLVDTEGKSDTKVSRELRDNFTDALKKRQLEAEGERRLSAYLAKRYVITEKSRGVLFSVRYRAAECRSWTDENDGRNLVTFPKVLLTEVVRSIVSDGENKQKLLPVVMAAVSPRMFWNLARLFPDDMEAGLKQLVPDADWSFIDAREKFLSMRGRLNKENKEQMG